MESSYNIFYHQLQQIQDTGIKYDKGGHILGWDFCLEDWCHNQSVELVFWTASVKLHQFKALDKFTYNVWLCKLSFPPFNFKNNKLLMNVKNNYLVIFFTSS